MLSLYNCSTLNYLSLPMQGSLEAHVETLFRRQNQASGQVMMLLLEEHSTSKLDQLENAEQLMLSACKPLNEYAVLERDNQKISLVQKRYALDSINPCEIQTKKLEIMLNNYLSGD